MLHVQCGDESVDGELLFSAKLGAAQSRPGAGEAWPLDRQQNDASAVGGTCVFAGRQAGRSKNCNLVAQHPGQWHPHAASGCCRACLFTARSIWEGETHGAGHASRQE